MLPGVSGGYRPGGGGGGNYDVTIRLTCSVHG